MSVETVEDPKTELENLKTRLKTTWESGDYGHFATYLEPGALTFLERVGIQPDEKVLDVACGAGQISLPMARQGARVTGLDLAENLVAQARARARDAGVDVRFEQGDVEALPYEDGSFDVVISLLGAMFAPRADRVAEELLRVCRPGGRIIMGNWTPGGFVGEMFRTIGRYVPAPRLMTPPVTWGDPDTLRARFGAGVEQLQIRKQRYPFVYPFSPPEVVEFFREYYGPAQKAFAALDEAEQRALRHELEQLWQDHNQATDGSTHVEAEYLGVIATRA